MLPDETTAVLDNCLSVLPDDPEIGVYCPPIVDAGMVCWPYSLANQTLNISCAEIVAPDLKSKGVNLTEELVPPDAVAFRECGPDGNWIHGNWSNYSMCLDIIDALEKMNGYTLNRTTLAYIAFGGSLVSFVFLAIALYIFVHYRSLHCSRLSVHKNLIVALMLTNISMLIIAEPSVTQRQHFVYRDVNWLCKLLIFLQVNGRLSSIMWTWNEGFYLHNRITISVFDSKAPFKLLHMMGWGVPLVLSIIWAVLTEQTLTVGKCWNGYAETKWVFVIVAPMIAALAVNMLFLVNIIRILLTRLQNSHTMETEIIRKAFKAAAVLFPLLGITNLIFFVRPPEKGAIFQAYLIINSLLQSLQGILVAILYCFLNTEVRSALKKQYERTRISRHAQSGRTSRWSRKDTSVMLVSMSERRGSRLQRLRNTLTSAGAATSGSQTRGSSNNSVQRVSPSLLSQHNRLNETNGL